MPHLIQFVNRYCFSYFKDVKAKVREITSHVLGHTASRWPSGGFEPRCVLALNRSSELYDPLFLELSP